MTNVDILLRAVDQASKNIGTVSNSLLGMDKSAATAEKGVNFSLSKISGALGAASGAAAVMAGTFKTAFEIGKQGAAINQTADSFDNLLTTIGAAPDLLNQLRKASLGTVDDMTLMSSTATLLAGTSGELALSLADATPQLLEIAKAAQKVNPLLGDTSFLYQSIATGIKRAQPDILDNLGLTIKIGEANEKYAKQLGKTVEELTANEKQQALLNATLEAGNILIAQAGGNADSAGDSFARLETAIKNVSDAAKSKLAPGLASAAEAANILITGADQINAAYETQIGKIQETSDSYAEYFEQAVLVGIAAGKIHENTWKNIDAYENNAEALAYVTEHLGINTEEMWGNAKAVEYDVAWFNRLSGIIPQVASSTKEATAATNDFSGAQRNLADATINLREAQQNWAENTAGDVQNALEAAGVSGEDYDNALKGLDETLGSSLVDQNNYKKDLQAIADEYKKTGDVDKFKQKTGELKDKYMALDDSIQDATDSLWRFKLMWDTLQSKSLTLDVNIPGVPSAGAGDIGLGGGDTVVVPDTDPGGSQDGARRASGGPVSGYLVNESAHTRPETLVLGNRNGQVLTKQDAMAAMGGGGMNIYGPITIVANDPASLLRQMQAMGKQSRLASISGAQYQGG